MILVGQGSPSRSSSGEKLLTYPMIWASYSRRHRSSKSCPLGGASRRRSRHELAPSGDDAQETRHVGQQLRKLLFGPKPVSPPPRHCRPTLRGRLELRFARGRLPQGRIEEHLRREARGVSVPSNRGGAGEFSKPLPAAA